MRERVKKDLQSLSTFDRWVVVMYWRWLLIKQKYKNQPLTMRLVQIHAVLMLVILFNFPHHLSPMVKLPLITAASYYCTLLILFLNGLRIKRAVPGQVQ